MYNTPGGKNCERMLVSNAAKCIKFASVTRLGGWNKSEKCQ